MDMRLASSGFGRLGRGRGFACLRGIIGFATRDRRRLV